MSGCKETAIPATGGLQVSRSRSFVTPFLKNGSCLDKSPRGIGSLRFIGFEKLRVWVH